MNEDSPIAVAGFGEDALILVSHCLTGPWFQILSHAEARALAADLIAATA